MLSRLKSLFYKRIFSDFFICFKVLKVDSIFRAEQVLGIFTNTGPPESLLFSLSQNKDEKLWKIFNSISLRGARWLQTKPARLHLYCSECEHFRENLEILLLAFILAQRWHILSTTLVPSFFSNFPSFQRFPHILVRCTCLLRDADFTFSPCLGLLKLSDSLLFYSLLFWRDFY